MKDNVKKYLVYFFHTLLSIVPVAAGVMYLFFAIMVLINPHNEEGSPFVVFIPLSIAAAVLVPAALGWYLTLKKKRYVLGLCVASANTIECLIGFAYFAHNYTH